MDDTHSADVDTTDSDHTEGPRALARAAQPPLPLAPGSAGELDRPIGFSLTARARRTVAPGSLPPLSVVDDGDLEQPGDTRPARARALRRSGCTLEEISGQLGVDELVVRAWVLDVQAGGRPGGGGRRIRAVAAANASATPSDGSALDGTHDDGQALTRAQAAGEASARLSGDARFAAGVGALAGVASVDRHGLTLTIGDARLGGWLLSWLREQDPLGSADLRVVLRVGDAVSADLARHRWAGELGVDLGHVAHARWRGAPSGDAVQAIVRVREPRLAASVAGWRDALTQPPSSAAPVAF